MHNIRLVTLNIEGHKHLDRWLPIVKALGPDVVCLQEVFVVDLPRIQETLEMQAEFVPMCEILEENKYGIHPLGKWGIAELTALPTRNKQALHYGGSETLPVFHEPNDSQRMVLAQEVQKSDHWFPIATTHFTWSPQGEISELQREDFARLQKIIQSFDELILCGDFNSPRGKEMFSLFSGVLNDCLPETYTTTIDPNLHYAGDLQLVVDTIFTTPGLVVSDVRSFSGVSDHMGVVGEVENANN